VLCRINALSEKRIRVSTFGAPWFGDIEFTASIPTPCAIIVMKDFSVANEYLNIFKNPSNCAKEIYIDPVVKAVSPFLGSALVMSTTNYPVAASAISLFSTLWPLFIRMIGVDQRGAFASFAISWN